MPRLNGRLLADEAFMPILFSSDITHIVMIAFIHAAKARSLCGRFLPSRSHLLSLHDLSGSVDFASRISRPSFSNLCVTASSESDR
jgi:hypothetical protein